MCRKYDCSMFVIGLHSKKRPNNIVIGRLHDGELLDMFELGMQSYEALLSTNVCYLAMDSPKFFFRLVLVSRARNQCCYSLERTLNKIENI